MAAWTETLIVGAGPAGLAVAGCLSQTARPCLVVDQATELADRFRHHYDRLHLHTTKAISGLPGRPMPADYPHFPSRDQVVAYLEDYARHFRIEPRLDERVERIARDADGFVTTTSKDSITSRYVVLATGLNHVPFEPDFPGKESFGGVMLHSKDYRNGSPFADQRVLVVGSGNTGAEIAIDLVEHGARKVALCVRDRVDVIPRTFLGLGITTHAILAASLPLSVKDAVMSRISRWVFGDLSEIGFSPSGEPVTRIHTRGRIPLIDIGTVDLVRRGKIEVVGPISRFEPGVAIVKRPGSEEERPLDLDAVILATGYRPELARLLPEPDELLDPKGVPRTDGTPTAVPGLFFVGFGNPPTGILREIGIAAKRVAALIRKDASQR